MHVSMDIIRKNGCQKPELRVSKVLPEENISFGEKVANMIQALYSKYLELKSKNQKLSDRNLDLESRVDRLREEVSVIKKENAALLNVAYDMDRVVAVLGENKVKEAIEVAKHLEQANAKRKIKKRRIDREGDKDEEIKSMLKKQSLDIVFGIVNQRE